MATPSAADFNSQATATLGLLNSTKDIYTNKYLTQNSNSKSSNSQLSSLNQQVKTLKAKLANVKNISDTYDREYQDRLVDKPLSGFWRARGIITLQDWVLFFFFVVYAIIGVGLTAIAAASSATNGFFNGFVVGSVAFCFGVMISATIMRFA
jgi:hypothetical protein